ncbi:MAG: HAD hydrolase family protein [Myxococcaceae bacterium]|nr:HAD hydrolase family protein [Myxococcaceae bacterium]
MSPKRGSKTKPTAASLAQQAQRVELMVFDVDGVLTDGGLYYGVHGEMQKRFDVKDGHGMVMARLTKLPCALLTARVSDIVAIRGRELGLAAVVQGKKFKGPAFLELCQQMNVDPSRVSYMGDDVNDLPALELAGLRMCPADARPEVQKVCHVVTKAPGGHGAAREAIEWVLKAKGLWEQALAAMNPS